MFFLLILLPSAELSCTGILRRRCRPGTRLSARPNPAHAFRYEPVSTIRSHFIFHSLPAFPSGTHPGPWLSCTGNPGAYRVSGSLFPFCSGSEGSVAFLPGIWYNPCVINKTGSHSVTENGREASLSREESDWSENTESSPCAEAHGSGMRSCRPRNS